MHDPATRTSGILRQLTTGAALLLLLSGGPLVSAADGAGRSFTPTGGWVGEPAEWVSVDGQRLAFGTGTRAHVATGLIAPVLQRSLSTGLAVRDAVLVEDRLFVSDGAKVGVLDLGDAAPSLRAVRLSPSPAGGLRMARLTDYLVVAEDGLGLRLLLLPPPAGMPHADHRSHPRHAGHAPTAGRERLQQVAFHPLAIDFSALTAAGSVVYALSEFGVVTAVDFNNPEAPRTTRRRIDPTTRALAAGGTTLYALTDAGLVVVDMSREDATGVSRHPEIRGTGLQVAGRAIQVAAGEGGLRTYTDRSPTAAIIEVTVGNNFFSPQDVTVSPGDTVRWTKTSGFHNVEGCSPGAGAQRCGTLTSTEVFRSGEETFDPFVYTHTFTMAGTHSYLCVVHAFGGSGMIGSVTVGGGPTCGDGDVDPFSEECDDGNVVSGDGCEADCTFTLSGELPPTLTLDKAGGDDIALSWGPSCLASDSAAGVYEGAIPDFQAYSLRSCNYTGGVATLLPGVGDTFYLVVPHNPSSEGSYGADSSGNPRAAGTSICKPRRLGSCP